MIAEVFIPLMVLGLVLVVLGIVFTQHTELAIVGFVFLLVLGLQMNTGQVEYRTGSNITASVGYNGSSIDTITQNVQYAYVPFNNSLSEMFGKYTAIAAAFGVIVMFFALTRFY